MPARESTSLARRLVLPLCLGALAAGVVGFGALRSRKSDGRPALAQPDSGPPPVPGPRLTVNYPKPPPELPNPLPPWKFPEVPEGAAQPEVNRPVTDAALAGAADADSEGNRCAEGSRTRLFVLDHGRLDGELSTAEVVALAGHFQLEDGRFGGRDLLPLGALLAGREGASGLEVWPCHGEVIERSAADLSTHLTQAGEQLVLMRTRRGELKLMDLMASPPRVLAGNLAAIRILR